MAKKAVAKESVAAPRQKPYALVDTRVAYWGDNLDQLRKRTNIPVSILRTDPFMEFQAMIHGREMSGSFRPPTSR